MSENLSFMVKVRDKGEITLPIALREKMKLITGTLLGIDILESGQICLHRIVPHRMPNNRLTEREKQGSV